MPTLIINADDLGVAPSTDTGIFRAFREGVLTSATALATSARFAEVVAQAGREGLPLGVHLNLTLGKSVLPAERIPRLADEKGFFRLTSRDFPRLLGGRNPDRELLGQVRDELDAQFAAARDTGAPFTHFDSHQYVHMIPSVFAQLAEIAPRHGFTRMRLAAERMGLFQLRHKPLAALARRNHLKWLWLRYAARSLRGPFAVPDAFYGILHSGLMDTEVLCGLLRNLAPGTVSELCIHPGEPCAPEEAAYPQPFANGFIASPWRQRELEALTAPKVRALAGELGVTLAPFTALQPQGRPDAR